MVCVRCRICGKDAIPCLRPVHYPLGPDGEPVALVEHCTWHHWEAVDYALGVFVGPLFPPAFGQPVEWPHGPGEPLPDPRDPANRRNPDE